MANQGKIRPYTMRPYSRNLDAGTNEFLDWVRTSLNSLAGTSIQPGEGIGYLSNAGVDPTTPQIVSLGSRPQSAATVITFVSDGAGNITFHWDGTNGSQPLQVYRDDGTITPAISGSLKVTGLNLNTVYFFYPYYDEASGRVLWPSTNGVSKGSPAVAFPSQNIAALQQQIMRNRIPLGYLLSLTGASTAAGSGSAGGGGGGGNGNRVPLPIPASGVLLETNGVVNPTQSRLNLEGDNLDIAVSDDALGNVTISKVRFNTSRVTWLEDFTSNPGMNSGISNIFGGAAIGEKGWYFNSLTSHANSGVVSSGDFPFCGYVFWANNATVSSSGRLVPGWEFQGETIGSGNSNLVDGNGQLLPLFDYPGWTMSFIFRFAPVPTDPSGNPFSLSKKSFYIGLFGVFASYYNQSDGSSRPDKFVGLRFDLDPTAPALSDANFVLEAVVNATNGPSPTRKNTQGTTKVTSVTPAKNTIYRLDISCTVAGQVTLTLNQSNTDTLTATVPTDTLQIGGNFAAVNPDIIWCRPSQSGAYNWASFGVGSKLTFSGIPSGGLTVLNGLTFVTQLCGNNPSVPSFSLEFLNNGVPTVAAAIPGSGIVTGYPAVYPGVWFGNDSESGPTSNTALIQIDKIYFDWTGGSLF